MLDEESQETFPVEVVYPVWQTTDWTPRQRTRAIFSLLLLAVSCALIALIRILLGTGYLAERFFPLAFALFALSLALLGAVFWYPYYHAQNRTSVHGESRTPREQHDQLLSGVRILSGVLVVGAALGFVIQTIDMVVVAIRGDDLAWGLTSILSLGLIGMGALICVPLSLSPSSSNWIPTRNPDAPGSALTAPATGIRLLLRWIVMIVARFFGAIVLGALFATSQITVTWPIIAALWLAAVFFLACAVIELLPTRAQE